MKHKSRTAGPGENSALEALVHFACDLGIKQRQIKSETLGAVPSGRVRRPWPAKLWQRPARYRALRSCRQRHDLPPLEMAGRRWRATLPPLPLPLGRRGRGRPGRRLTLLSSTHHYTPPGTPRCVLTFPPRRSGTTWRLPRYTDGATRFAPAPHPGLAARRAAPRAGSAAGWVSPRRR